MRIIDIACKDLLQIVRDRKSLLFLVLMPVLFTLFMGFAFSRSQGAPRLPVGWIDRDAGGAYGTLVRELIESSQPVKLQDLTEDEVARVDRLIRDEKLAAAVFVPAGFTVRAQQGQPVPLEILTATGSRAGQTAATAITAAAKRVLGAVQTGEISAAVSEESRPFPDVGARASFEQAGVVEALAAWDSPAVQVVTEASRAASAARAEAPSGFEQSSPGMIVMFSVFSLITSAMVLVLERKSGALSRLFTMPVQRWEVIGGHLLALFLVVILQDIVLVALGQLAFRVNYLAQPTGVALILASLALWVASLGLLIGVISQKEEHVVMYSLIAMFLFSALGGAWFPREIAGAGFGAISRPLPTSWAMQGLQDLILRGKGFGAALLPAEVMLLWAAACFGLAVWQLRARVQTR